MRAVVIYESMFGNTRKVAEAIALGAAQIGEVTTVRAGEATHAALAHANLIIVGGPTHAHGMVRPKTREMAIQMSTKPANRMTLDPGAAGKGLREWFAALGPIAGPVAAFDTKMPGPGVFTGRASKRIARLLRRHGGRLISAPQSFVVLKTNELADGEQARAAEWGRMLAATVAAVATPVADPAAERLP